VIVVYGYSAGSALLLTKLAAETAVFADSARYLAYVLAGTANIDLSVCSADNYKVIWTDISALSAAYAF